MRSRYLILIFITILSFILNSCSVDAAVYSCDVPYLRDLISDIVYNFNSVDRSGLPPIYLTPAEVNYILYHSSNTNEVIYNTKCYLELKAFRSSFSLLSFFDYYRNCPSFVQCLILSIIGGLGLTFVTVVIYHAYPPNELLKILIEKLEPKS